MSIPFSPFCTSSELKVTSSMALEEPVLPTPLGGGEETLGEQLTDAGVVETSG